jgi:predicted  nucleic acid-binding Zn-ribbon protein
MSWVDAIVRLQNIDMELEAINKRLAEIAVEKKDKSGVERAQKILQKRQASADQVRHAQDDLEFELDRVERKLKETEARLYGGQIRNPRELQDFQAEAKSLRHRKEQLEDQLLEAMINREDAEAEAEAAETEYQATKAQWEARQAALIEENTALYERGTALSEEKEALLPKIPSSVLDSYQYLRPRVGAYVVSYLRGRTCSLCGIEVLPTLRQRVRMGEEVYCDSCGRLLVMES